MSNSNKLLSYILMQIRKRSLTFLFATQSLEWCDKRLQFQTDILCQCCDLAMKPEGKRRHMERGKVIGLDFYDYSGAWSGEKYRHQAATLRHAETVWPWYDTTNIIDPNEAFQKIDMSAGQREAKMAEIVAVKSFVFDTLSAEVKRGVSSIDAEEMWSMFKEVGLESSSTTLGRIIKSLGAVRHQYSKDGGGFYYDISKLVEPGNVEV